MGDFSYPRIDITPVWARFNDDLIRLVDYVPVTVTDVLATPPAGGDAVAYSRLNVTVAEELPPVTVRVKGTQLLVDRDPQVEQNWKVSVPVVVVIAEENTQVWAKSPATQVPLKG